MAAIITMPNRFDYSAMNSFNTEVSEALVRNHSLNGDEQKIVLDCKYMDYIDSAGLGLLVMAFKRAQAKKCILSVVNIKPTAREILLLANLQKLIDIQ